MVLRMPNTSRRPRGGRNPTDHDPTRLRTRRVALGLSQTEVAAAAELSSGHLSELEGGTRNPSPATLARLALALDCDTTDLMPEVA